MKNSKKESSREPIIRKEKACQTIEQVKLLIVL
jgi:hypothetical protein